MPIEPKTKYLFFLRSHTISLINNKTNQITMNKIEQLIQESIKKINHEQVVTKYNNELSKRYTISNRREHNKQSR